MRVQIYGQADSWWSNCNVTRGLAAGLLAHGATVTVYDRALGRAWERYVGDCTPGLDEDAEVGIYVGYAVQLPLLGHKAHRFQVGALITESSEVPASWIFAARQCDLVICPSRWAAESYRCEKTLVVPHGLDPVFAEPPPGVAPAPGYRLLHIAGSRDFLDRKGTPQLVQACKSLFGLAGPLRDLRGHVKVTIRTPPGPHIEELLGNDPLFVLDAHTSPLTPARMRQLLTRDPWTAVVQPSRAEAFGMVPLEARACGVPVLMTACSGHLEHLHDRDCLVPSGPEAPITVNGIPSGQAPQVTAGHVEAGLLRLLRLDRHRGVLLPSERAAYVARWSWPAVTRSLYEHLAGALREPGVLH